VAWHALGTPSDDCDSVRIGSSGLRIECPIAPGTQEVARKPASKASPFYQTAQTCFENMWKHVCAV